MKNKEEKKQHLIDMMKGDEELGLYKETLTEYIERLKERRTEDNYKYSDEDFEKYKEYVEDCYTQNLSVYKCLEFMYFTEKENNKPRVYHSEILSDVLSKITPEELELTEIEMMNMVYEDTYTNKEIRTWWLNQTEERRRDMVREYFKGGNSENINTLYGIMPEEMEEMYNINVDVVIMDWEEILFDFIDFYPCQLPDELFEWLKENYEIPNKKDGKD
jgi:hypothetical protein